MMEKDIIGILEGIPGVRVVSGDRRIESHAIRRGCLSFFIVHLVISAALALSEAFSAAELAEWVRQMVKIDLVALLVYLVLDLYFSLRTPRIKIRFSGDFDKHSADELAKNFHTKPLGALPFIWIVWLR